MKSNTKNHILRCASRLFFAEGFATGIDRVTAECETAKMTIYIHFDSKDGLICAALRDIQASFLNALRSRICPASLSQREKLSAAFNFLCYAMHDEEYMLGLGVRAQVEFPNSEHPAHQAAVELDNAILGELGDRCGLADIPDSESVARELLLLAKGCFVMSPVVGIRGSRLITTTLAGRLLDGWINPRAPRTGTPIRLAQASCFPQPHDPLRPKGSRQMHRAAQGGRISGRATVRGCLAVLGRAH